MVSLAEALLVLVPGIDLGPGGNCTVTDDGTGQRITRWDASLGTQPTAAQIAAVTADQVTVARLAKVRSSAASGLAADGDRVAVGVRASLALICDQFNSLCRAVGHPEFVLVQPGIFTTLQQYLSDGRGDPQA